MRSRFILFVLIALCSADGQTAPTLVGSGYGAPPSTSLAPGQIVTFWVAGMKAISTTPVQGTGNPLPTQVAGISVTLNQASNPKDFPMPSLAVPILSISQTNACNDPTVIAPACFMTSITVQVPFELVVDPFTMPPYTSLIVSQNGADSQAFNVSVADDAIHVLTTCGTTPTPCVTHLDGTVVSVSSPAVAGEVVTIYAVGLGVTVPRVATGQPSPTPAAKVTDSSVDLDFHPNAAPTRPGYPRPGIALNPPAFSGMTPGEVGLYQVNVQLPASFPTVPPCGGTVSHPIYSNLTITVSSAYFSWDGAAICVQPQ